MAKHGKTPASNGGAKEIEKRWTKPLADAGWTALPNVVLEQQATLGLSPMDLNIIMQIAKHWWQHGSEPYPSIGSIAEAIGVTPRSVTRHISKLVASGLLERNERRQPQGGQQSNSYTFKGLINRTTPFAEELVAERKRRKSRDKARVRRKSPLPAGEAVGSSR